jgi:hypothetical protein
MPLCAQMSSSGFSFADATSTATTGAWGRPQPATCVGAPGIREGDHGPSRRSPESPPLQGKGCEGPGSASFGGSDGLVCLVGEKRVTLQIEDLSVRSRARAAVA